MSSNQRKEDKKSDLPAAQRSGGEQQEAITYNINNVNIRMLPSNPFDQSINELNNLGTRQELASSGGGGFAAALGLAKKKKKKEAFVNSDGLSKAEIKAEAKLVTKADVLELVDIVAKKNKVVPFSELVYRPPTTASDE